MHIVIVGAGLGGLCLAQGLKQCGVAFEVYEKDAAPDSRTQGYRIRIDETGQRALAQCLPPELYRLFRETCSVTSSQGQFLDIRLRAASGRAPGAWQPSVLSGASEAPAKKIGGDFSAHRMTLREILLRGIEHHVHFGKAFTNFETRADGVVSVHFHDGTHALCDVLVGADGVSSAVAAQRLPHAQSVDTGSACIYGKTLPLRDADPSIAHGLLEGGSVVFADGFAVIIDVMRFSESAFNVAAQAFPAFRLSPVSDYLYWAFIGPHERLGSKRDHALSYGHESPLAVVRDLVSGWPPGLRAVFSNADGAAVSLLPVRSAALLEHWASSTVTLLGDAIHVMSPAGGLGANTALADSAMLARGLGEAASGRGALLDAIAAYEEDMRRRANEAIRASMEGAQKLFARIGARPNR